MCIGGIYMMQRYLELLRERDLLKGVKLTQEYKALPQPVYDHRLIKPGDAFFAIKGASFDGHKVIPAALDKGAVLIIGESDICDIQVKESRKAVALYAKEYYGKAAQAFTLFGVTGTNGKTTSSLMLYQLLRMQGQKCAWIGTLGYKIEDEHFETKHTTPDILELHQIFKQMADAGVAQVVMEVSSHALALDRVYGVDFDYNLFTNFSRDHLDFHKDLDEYFAAKYLLFERAALKGGISIINIDDAKGQEIARLLQEQNARVITLGSQTEANYRIEERQIGLDGSSFLLKDSAQQVLKANSPLIGDFNIDNLALALVSVMQSGIKANKLEEQIPQLMAVPGRIEKVANERGVGIYVDYAHTPDAIINLLKSVEKLPHRRIISIIGAGGDRDSGKRPLMLQAALRHSNVVIVTNDNPRSEEPAAIIGNIVKDRDFSLPWWVIRDRKEAIKTALNIAQSGDVVVICGKGHENYQEIGGTRYPFDDRQVAAEAAREARHCKAADELLLPLDPLLLELLCEGKCDYKSLESQALYRYISTDSRSIKPGSLFFALEGETFDGNDFISKVLDTPDCFAVGKRQGIDHPRYLQHPQPQELMTLLLHKYLQIFDVYKIAITGSTGKTSSKELIYNILSSVAPTLKSDKNENNILGVCKTILRLEAYHEYAIFEVGTNHFGEIAEMAECIRPQAGIILNVGASHLEYFVDETGVYREKTELFRRNLHLKLFPADDLRFSEFRDSGKCIGQDASADYRICGQKREEQGQSFYLNSSKYYIQHQAPHFVSNAAFGIALGKELGLQDADIQSALYKNLDLGHRMQVEKVNGRWLILDCYNANPVSMQAAIEYWQGFLPEQPHIAFLGDMLELGSQSEKYHAQIAAILKAGNYHELYSIGSYSMVFNPDQSRHFSKVQDLLAVFPALPDSAIVLIKASHGIQLEKIIPRLKGAS